MGKAHTVLLIEADNDITRTNIGAFKQAGYNVRKAATLAQARESLASALPDVIVLDNKLPDGSGLDFINEIRSVTATPILMLSSSEVKDDKIRALMTGGNDYIIIPYYVDELVTRADAFLRREALYKATDKPLLKNRSTDSVPAGRIWMIVI